MVQIRRAGNGDIVGVTSVIRAVYDEYGFTWEPEGYHADLYDIELHYDREGNEFFLAEEDGEIVGTAALEFFPKLPSLPHSPVILDDVVRAGAADCSLERLYVDPKSRRKGIGSALMKNVLRRASERNASYMEIWSDKRFVDAHRLYERFAAKVVGERICGDPDESPEWGLCLAIATEPATFDPHR